MGAHIAPLKAFCCLSFIVDSDFFLLLSSFYTILFNLMIFTGGQNEWKERNNTCYMVVNRNVSNADAKDECQTKGATLASIRDDSENLFLKDL